MGVNRLEAILTPSLELGVERGRQEQTTRAVLQVLQQRFGTLAPDVATELTIVARISALKESLDLAMTAATLADFTRKVRPNPWGYIEPTERKPTSSLLEPLLGAAYDDGCQRGRMEIARTAILQVLGIRFCTLLPKVAACIDCVTDLAHMEALLDVAITTPGIAEFVVAV